MSDAWRRILVASGVIVLVALGVLEIAASHLQTDQWLTVTGGPDRGEEQMPWQDSLNAQGRLLGAELGPSADPETGSSAGEHGAASDDR